MSPSAVSYGSFYDRYSHGDVRNSRLSTFRGDINTPGILALDVLSRAFAQLLPVGLGLNLNGKYWGCVHPTIGSLTSILASQ